MFSLLKQRFKSRIARILNETRLIQLEAEMWTRMLPCTFCERIIPINAHFCSYCGHRVGTPETFRAFDTLTSPTADNHQQPKPVNIILPGPVNGRIFLEYVRKKKEQIGPATIAHRQQQNINVWP